MKQWSCGNHGEYNNTQINTNIINKSWQKKVCLGCR